jgi:hypothetical protein
MGGYDADRSWELEIDFDNLPPTRSVEEMSADGVMEELWPEATQAGIRQPDLVVFDPMGFSLADQLARVGFGLRAAQTGVDVMTLVAARPTGAVVCGPAEDAERRRLLTAALRLRFPSVPVVYVSTHAGNPAAVQGAKAEGAELVVPLPLPSPDEVRELLGIYVRPTVPQVLPDPQTGPVVADATPETMMLSAEELARQKQKWAALTPQQGGPVKPRYSTEPPRPPAYSQMSHSFNQPPTAEVDPAQLLDPAVPMPITLQSEPTASAQVLRDEFDFDSELPTDRVHVPALKTPVSGSVTVTRDPPKVGDPATPHTSPDVKGEVGALLGAISPFLWGLEDAAKYVNDLAADGDMKAASHARTLQLLTKLLTQLKDRIDDLGL